MDHCAGARGHLRICLLQRHSRLHAAHYREPPGMNAGIGRVVRSIKKRLQGQWGKDIRPLKWVRSYKALRHDPDDTENDVVNLDLLSNHVGRAVEPALPELLADDHAEPRRITALAIVQGG